MSMKNYGFIIIVAIVVVLCALGTYNLYMNQVGEINLICYARSSNIARSLLVYAKKNGRFPSNMWDQTHSCPYWVQACCEIDKGCKSDLKCPTDNSNSVTSYEFNPAIAGRALSDLQRKDLRIELIREKLHRGTHSRVYYLCYSTSFYIVTDRKGKR